MADGKKVVGTPFHKGKSGNPNGRPKGAAGLAKYLRRLTRNGRDGGDILLSIARGDVTRPRYIVTKDGPVAVEEPPSFAESIAAIKVIYDRMHGTAQKFIEVSGPGGGPLLTILDNLEHASDEDLDALEDIAKRTAGVGSAPGESPSGEGEEGGETEA